MSEPADQLRELLEHVTEALGVDAEVEVVEDDESIRGTLHGDDLGLFIGRHGATIDAVQASGVQDRRPRPHARADGS
jgi:spoIIIJ-associated protein